jgi:hypothetical protein
MSDRIRVAKLYQKWVVEFPFKVTVYCDTWKLAISAVSDRDLYFANRWIGK